jgi:hypothetical protein
MAKPNRARGRSKVGPEAYVHRGSGDAKVGPGQPGLSSLPDGRVALTARLIEELARASQAARRGGKGAF